MKYLWTATALMILFVLMPGDAAAEASAQARVTVEVTNHAANGAPVAGDEITLVLYQGEEPIDSRAAQVAEDGRAVFENVSTGPDRVAVARVKHQNMAFQSRPVPLDPAAGEFSALVEVFDVSTDTSRLFVGTHHIMVAAHSTSLEFTEYMQLSNSCDKAVTGSQRDDRNRPVVIRIGLPESFGNLTASSYFEQEALVVDRDGFYDTMAVPPGEHQVTFSYRIEVDRGTMKIVKPITLPTSELMILWEHGQGRLEGLGEPSGRLVNAEGAPVEFYRRTDLKPGDKLAFRISGFNVKRSDPYTWIILAAVFVAMVVIALLRLRPRSAESGQQHA